MEVRRILYMLLIGGLLCMVMAGVLKCMDKSAVESTEQPMEFIAELDEEISPLPEKIMSPITAPPQKQEEILTVQDTSQPISPTEAPQETKAPQKTNAPRKIVAPQETKAPEETAAPQETKSPMPQNTQLPIPTNTPPVTEEIHEHDFEKAVWELPTCQMGGYYNNICKICGFVECISQEPLSHETEDIVIQEGNCMEDRVIRHVCKFCGEPTESDTRYPIYDEHQWSSEEVDGVMVEYCERCGIVK